MRKRLRNKKRSCPTDLTWEERNPSNYLFDDSAFLKLEKTIARTKDRLKEEKSEKG